MNWTIAGVCGLFPIVLMVVMAIRRRGRGWWRLLWPDLSKTIRPDARERRLLGPQVLAWLVLDLPLALAAWGLGLFLIAKGQPFGLLLALDLGVWPPGACS